MDWEIPLAEELEVLEVQFKGFSRSTQLFIYLFIVFFYIEFVILLLLSPCTKGREGATINNKGFITTTKDKWYINIHKHNKNSS